MGFFSAQIALFEVMVRLVIICYLPKWLDTFRYLPASIACKNWKCFDHVLLLQLCYDAPT